MPFELNIKKIMNNESTFLQFSENHCSCVFMYFENTIVYRIQALLEQAVCLKRLITSMFRSSEPLRLNGRVDTIPTYRVYQFYDTHVCSCFCLFRF